MHLLADIAYGFVACVVAIGLTALILIGIACVIRAASDWAKKP